MKRTIVAVLAATLLAAPVFARNPPKTAKGSPAPPVWDRRGGELADLDPAIHDGGSFVPELRPWLSGAMFPSLLRPATGHSSTIGARPDGLMIAPENVPFSISPQYTVNASASSDAGVEPAVISITRSGTDSTALSWQQLGGNGFYSLRTASSSNLRDSNATFSRTTVTIPTG